MSQELFVAVGRCDEAEVERILIADPDLIFARDSEGNTLLHKAVATGNADLVRYFLSKQTYPYSINSYGEQPFHLALTLPNAREIIGLLQQHVHDTIGLHANLHPMSLHQYMLNRLIQNAHDEPFTLSDALNDIDCFSADSAGYTLWS